MFQNTLEARYLTNMGKILKNGLIGTLSEDTPFVIYCNEKEYNGTGFLFKCCKGCKHNA